MGPSILCPEKTAKSTSRALTSRARCGADWQASSTTRAPAARASATSVEHRVDGAEDVGGVGEGQHAGAAADQPGGGLEVQGPCVVDGDEFQDGAGPFGQLLPGNQVGVVLHLGDHDFVAGREREAGGLGRGPGQGGVQEGVAEQVQALGGVGGPDQLIRVRADEGSHGLAGILERFGGLHREIVRAAVHGRVPLLVELLLRFQHAERVLRGGAGIEVDERVPVDGPVQDGEVVADPQDLRVAQRGA